jgi:hypothetical protein
MSEQQFDPYVPPESAVGLPKRAESWKRRISVWLLNLGSVLALLQLIRANRAMPLFENMYEGLGKLLPVQTRFAFSSWFTGLCFLVFPLIVISSNGAWLMSSRRRIWPIAIATTIGVALVLFNVWAMDSPLRALQHAFDK